MSANGKQEQLRLGFLTALEIPENGFVGGLLVTNHCGRPLEFQCTTPVRPNSTQQILYGPTLEAFLLGELIGGTLVERAGVRPQVILVDREPILELRNHIDQPVALVAADGAGQADGVDEERIFRMGRQTMRFHPAHETDRGAVSQESAKIPATADLLEPFGRVREALEETLRSGSLR